MSSPWPDLPDELVPKLGDALKGWKHVTDTASTRLPTNLARANRIRRGALTFLNTPRKRGKAR